MNKRCYQKLATQIHGKTSVMIFKNQNFKTEFSSFTFWNLWKVRKCVNLLYIKCQDLKKRFSIKLTMCFYIITS